MLSRTAASLYWMGRYMERAENLARILEVGYRMNQMPEWESGGPRNEWRSTVIAASAEAGLIEKHGEASLDSAISYICLDEENPSSIMSCLKSARTNGRAVRTALTVDAWDFLNHTWLEFNGHWRKSLNRDNLLNFLDWVKIRATLFHGAIRGGMLRDEAFAFVNLGLHVERADNTARILDVKYHVLLPQGESLGGSVDYYQWATILRSVSALGSYHWLYRDSIKPWLVAELLILREEMPRSLVYTLGRVVRYLDMIAESHGKRHNCHRLAGSLYSQLGYAQIEEVFQGGLHEYLTEFLARTNALGDEIARNYHFV
ncbi:alpha-E domain-containing protein [Emcibacter nanhaiensis]|uniref:Alpha-E domain-containing protein n=1 Tax=Emcibacter nanhaiensis TaxID=1505037 RepID=A0A501PGE2_9PROT|nr:alpha-E domain-containing protein [Emcibacter nanhaiensis]TPD59127.1 alpha-E domain-containing protein [Emcibacter nanhaiensis]